jgi:hypothetical protein
MLPKTPDSTPAFKAVLVTDRSNGHSRRKRTPLRITQKTPQQQEPVGHSVYLGRERLGRYLKFDREHYTAFDADDRTLGDFPTQSKALSAIRKAQKVRL